MTCCAGLGIEEFYPPPSSESPRLTLGYFEHNSVLLLITKSYCAHLNTHFGRIITFIIIINISSTGDKENFDLLHNNNEMPSVG